MINFGKNKFATNGERVLWDPKKVVNGHMIVVGGSGTGKTFTIRKILRDLEKEKAGIMVHIVDVHGDIDVGADLSSTVSFSETSNNGLNPLKISADREFGGVRKKIRSFIAMINRTSRVLGTRQESVMISLLEDLYRAYGFVQENPETWTLSDVVESDGHQKAKRYPTLKDLANFSKFKLEKIFLGSNSEAVIKLEELNSKARALEKMARKLSKTQHDVDERAKAEEKLEKLKEGTIQVFKDYIASIKSGREIDEIIKYDSPEVIKSVYERVTSLESTGIFKPIHPKFDKTKNIRRYNIKSLNKDEQKMFVDILLEDIFLAAKERGEQTGVKTFIVIDEAHIFIDPSDEHIINVIIKEARKFGVGLILASQSFSHFTEDIIANTSTKIILGMDEMYHEQSSKKLRVESKRFTYIIPHKTMMIQIKNKGDMSNKFIDCEI